MKNKLLNNARAYIGVQQGSSRHKKLIDQYNAVKPLPVGYAMKYSDDWCAAFVTVVGDLTGAASYIGRECGVQRFVQIFKNKGSWRGLARPQAGDIVVFDWQKNGWSDHIGFVEKVSGNTITTIEGNTSRRVGRRTCAWNDWRITGYARPKYPTGSNDSKSVQKVAQEVIDGKWGNGEERVRQLTEAGYNAGAVQKEVNALMKKPNSQLKSNEAVAREVLDGKWGNGEDRKKRLTEAGYNYGAVQKIVNQLVKM